MGVNLKDIFERTDITLNTLAGRIIAVDTYNMLYQFLTSIRTPDGQLLTDSKGKITSHLIGLFARTSALLEKNIKPVFVFDGKPPDLKLQELHRRAEVKADAAKKHAQAEAAGDIAGMKKYAARTTRLEKSMVEEAKTLIRLLGLPAVQAPSEGEAQCARLVATGKAWATASQDYDSLLHNTTRLVQNLSLSGKRKIKGTLGSVPISPSLIDLPKNLDRLQLTQHQLILLALLVGTDYNPGGIHGIGPHKALKLVKQHNTAESLSTAVHWNDHFSHTLQELHDLISTIPTTDDAPLTFMPISAEELTTFLVDQHDFSHERVSKTLATLTSVVKEKSQRGLKAFM